MTSKYNKVKVTKLRQKIRRAKQVRKTVREISAEKVYGGKNVISVIIRIENTPSCGRSCNNYSDS